MLTRVFDKLRIHFSSLEYFSNYDAIDFYETRETNPEGTSAQQSAGLGTDPSVASLDMAMILLENERFRLENADLQSQLARNEEVSTARHNDLMNLIQGFSQSANPASCPTAQSPSPAAVDPSV